MLNVLVLGAGPAGLLAAHTAIQLGAGVAVWSRGAGGQALKSELHGCQYLHEDVLEGLGDPVEVSYRLNGSAEGYRRKVYGDDWHGQVSPDEYGAEENHLAWNLRLAYDHLWRFWGSKVQGVDQPLDWTYMEAFLRKMDTDLILSTIPAPALCRRLPGSTGGTEEEHSFTSQMVWAIGQTMGESRLRQFDCPDNTVVCDGTRDVGWYRKARVFGHTTVEYPYREGKRVPITGLRRVEKPLRTNCDCHLDSGKVVRLGRYGKWQKGYLVHQVVEDTAKAIASVDQRLF